MAQADTGVQAGCRGPWEAISWGESGLAMGIWDLQPRREMQAGGSLSQYLRTTRATDSPPVREVRKSLRMELQRPPTPAPQQD